MEQWEKNYYISAIAGANNGSSLVVMSKGLWWRLVFGTHHSGFWCNFSYGTRAKWMLVHTIPLVCIGTSTCPSWCFLNSKLFKLLMHQCMGSDSILSFVISGTSYTQQSYKVSDSFPFKWINKKWREGFYVTSMATAGSRWGVVMSRNAGFSDQVWFICCPSNYCDGLHFLTLQLLSWLNAELIMWMCSWLPYLSWRF